MSSKVKLGEVSLFLVSVDKNKLAYRGLKISG
jgi:hypothetical protein